jgi:hypothetical protein
MADFDNVSNSEISVDADVDALTFQKLLNRDDYLDEVMSGAHTDKIVAQAIETQAAGSGDGLAIDRFNRLEASGTTLFTTNGTTDIDTGISTTAARTADFMIAPQTAGGSTAIYDASLVALATTGRWYIRVVRSGDASTSQNVDWKFWALAVT